VLLFSLLWKRVLLHVLTLSCAGFPGLSTATSCQYVMSHITVPATEFNHSLAKRQASQHNYMCSDSSCACGAASLGFLDPCLLRCGLLGHFCTEDSLLRLLRCDLNLSVAARRVPSAADATAVRLSLLLQQFMGHGRCFLSHC
jgi:hypothetical protein